MAALGNNQYAADYIFLAFSLCFSAAHTKIGFLLIVS